MLLTLTLSESFHFSAKGSDVVSLHFTPLCWNTLYNNLPLFLSINAMSDLSVLFFLSLSIYLFSLSHVAFLFLSQMQIFQPHRNSGKLHRCP